MIKLYIVVLSLILLPSFALADILNPYVVDEKPQVMFADSTPVSTSSITYMGLENYKSEYINNFVHISFSYTHSSCCTATYPPILYITDIDPRTSTSTNVLYAAAPYTISIHEPTDVYFYDIQFNDTGYYLKVKRGSGDEVLNTQINIGGIKNTDFVALTSRYRVSPIPTNESMAFTPMRVKDNVDKRIDPVIIIPGIMGSAYKNGELVLDPILHTYDDLVDTLIANGYQKNIDLFTFPYEWRDSNILSAAFLRNKIEQIKDICKCGKVDIVAHSMGGLVARQYIQSDNYKDDIDQIIFLGTPHKGAVTDYLRWEAGEFEPGIFNSITKYFFKEEARVRGYTKNGDGDIFAYIQNRPIQTVEQLLPIFSYLKDKNSNVKEYPDSYPKNVFLENINNNKSKLINSGIEITNIVGDIGDTINYIRVSSSTNNTLWQHGEPDGFYTKNTDNGLERGAGDGTVTLYGATIDESIPNENVTASHSRIPTVEANRVYKILTGKESSSNIDNGFQINPYVLILQLQSPIDFVVTAPDGKKIGKNFSTNSEYNEIPGAFYSGFSTEEEYITILNPQSGQYKIQTQGTGAGGGYGILTSYISDNISTTTKIIGTTAPGQITDLSINFNKDNPTNIETEKIVTLNIFIEDINQAYKLGWIKNRETKELLIKTITQIMKFEIRNNIKIEKKIDKVLIRILKTELDLLLKKKKITQEGYSLIKYDIDYLIKNN